MFKRILSDSGVKGITVCQEREPFLLFAQICHYLRVIRPKKRHIAKFPKMHLDRYEFSLHVNIFDTRRNTQFP